jgi:hypothetical protein
MSATYAIANVQHALQALKEKIPSDQWGETPLPVIAAPGWWMEEVRKEMGVAPGFEPGEIHGCHVTRMDTLAEPMLLDHDGKMYAILPQWLRASTSSKLEVEDGSGQID